ncbi:hypothetical protein [Amycolatopsis echigonensis]|uniref:Uncharacterized protein n=1 Tax=Amycolatopsis echigonensis TaxID=2576905 RepID=A0A2N3X0G2_9PSEU|nr:MULTISPECIES: hypothetical protein [Amycolatopsis]MBB2501180.1 hypothetical protein [Amycolatopsis echigonensis]PKV99599.1 hypothetical protein ATK30_0579 [Amycolatopsis niigatensis]
MTNQPDPLPAADAGDRVWRAVEATGETGLRGPDICETQNLTHSQFENGKAHVRDYRCADEQKCFLYDGDVYVVTRDPGRAATAMAAKMRSIDKQLIRLHKSACDPIAKDGVHDEAFRYLKKQLEAMIDNLNIMRQSGYSVHSKQIREAAQAR